MGRAKVSIHSPTKMGFSEVKAGVLATGRACEWDLGNSLGEWLKGFGLDGRNNPMRESEKNISEEWRK